MTVCQWRHCFLDDWQVLVGEKETSALGLMLVTVFKATNSIVDCCCTQRFSKFSIAANLKTKPKTRAIDLFGDVGARSFRSIVMPLSH